MASVVDVITNTFPANNDVNVPLVSSIIITFDREMNTSRLQEDFFVEGVDTDQFVGPGQVELKFPDNISQNNIDDFFESPGYKGIASGSFDFSGSVSGVNTILKWSPTRPFAPLTVYTATISDTEDAAFNTVSGIAYLSFTTGTGSIQEIPASISTSILHTSIIESSITSHSFLNDLVLVKTTPANFSVQNATNLHEIVLHFNKDIDPSTVTDASINIVSSKASYHPNLNIVAQGELVKILEVVDNKIIIKI